LFFAEAFDVLKAAQIVWEEGIGFPILLGNKEILELKEEIGFDADVPIIDPKIKEEEARRNKPIPIGLPDKDVEFPFDAQKLMRERNYFAAMMVNEGEADALVTGHSRSYPSVVKPMLQLIEKRMELRLLPLQT
jgi:malate dehydrogenase (oxaloacetate-decarboxylating)(NADP+)